MLRQRFIRLTIAKVSIIHQLTKLLKKKKVHTIHLFLDELI